MQECSGFCPQSRRGIAPSEIPAQDVDQNRGETTRAPGSPGAKRTRTTEVKQNATLIYSNTHYDSKAYTHIPSETIRRTCTIPTPGRHPERTGAQRATVSGLVL